MDSLKNVGQPPVKKLLTGATEAHSELHNTVRRTSANVASRRSAHHSKMETELRLNPALGKGGA
jgi:hypothetical protein